MVKSFKQFIIESISLRPKEWDKNSFTNMHHLGNDNVRTWIDRTPENPKHYYVGFKVNSEYDHERAQEDSQNNSNISHHIVLHVAKVLHHFITKHDPDEVKFDSHNYERHDVKMGIAAQKLAQMTGRKYRIDPPNRKSISNKPVHVIYK